MSRCAHLQSEYKLRKLPKCTRCNSEFILVLVSYDNPDKKRRPPVYEWECPKCHKTVPKEFLKEEKLTEQDQFLSDRIKELQKKNNRQNLKRNK
jgi:hypothetical protein